MAARLKTVALSTLLMVPASVGAMAQSAGSPTPSTSSPPSGVGGWITGHPLTDLIVALVVIVAIAATYFMRQRSRA